MVLIISFFLPFILSKTFICKSGFPFHYGHICRALCCRLQDYFTSNPLPEPYRLNHPLIGHTSLQWKEEIQRTSNSYDSMNWNIYDQTIELIEPSLGRKK